MIEKFKKLSLRFLWSGNREEEGIHLVKWKTLVTPKSLGGWGLNNLHLFGRALADKSAWRLISSVGL